MSRNAIQVYVYGAEQVCPSCVNFPSSKETASWLSAALDRKYRDQVCVSYVDIFDPKDEDEKRNALKILSEEIWYPVVMIGNQIVAEGNPKLKAICAELEKRGCSTCGDVKSV